MPPPAPSPIQDRGINYPYKCDCCGAQPDPLSLCAKCRTVRYCNTDCQKKHWRQHKKSCVDVDKIYSYEAPAGLEKFDPSDPSNPLNLRSQPTVTEEELDDMADFCPHHEGGAIVKAHDDILDKQGVSHLDAALEWDNWGRPDTITMLSKDTKDKLIRTLRDWVYRQEVKHEQLKAVKLCSETSIRALKAIADRSGSLSLADFTQYTRLVAREDQASRAHEVGGHPVSSRHFLCGVTVLDGKVLTNNRSQYLIARSELETLEGRWLHESLLKHLPSDHDYSRFSTAADKLKGQIVASLLTLGVKGIDEASFLNLEDWVDFQKVQANMGWASEDM